MADRSKIEWTDATWNPITGCSPISVGCDNCYARRMAQRLKGRYGYPVDDPFKVTFHRDRLDQPLKWKKARRVFVCSMGDIFHDDVKAAWLLEIFKIMQKCWQHNFIILTKRPDVMYSQIKFFFYDCEIKKIIIPSNLWLGVTAENQEMADERIPLLLQIPAAVRFVSVEPMLEAVDLTKLLAWYCPQCNSLNPQIIWPCPFCKGDRYSQIDWIICGAETGQGARHFNLDWARDLRDQCKAAGVPFFFKSAGKQSTPDDLTIKEFPT